MKNSAKAGFELRGFMRRRWVYCVVSWLCAAWLVAVWTDGNVHALLASIPAGWPLPVLVILLIALPCAPQWCAVAVTACCAACMVVPYAGPDINWLNSAPIWLALAVLGHHWRSLKLAGVVLVLGCLPECIGVITGNELALSSAPSAQGCAMWWCVGALVGALAATESDKAVARERSEQYAHRLRVLHVLHDSLANNLVYAVLRCRALTAHDADSDAIHAGIGEIEGILKRCLAQLRQEVIVPERSALTAAGIETGNSIDTERCGRVSAESLSAALTPMLDELTRRLESQGWNGTAHLSGDCRCADAEHVRLVEASIRELGANMLKYGVPGAYALEVEACDDHVNVYSSNPVGKQAGKQAGKQVGKQVNDSTGDSDNASDEATSAFTSGCGLALLRREIESVGGSLECVQENGEWSVCITIPFEEHTRNGVEHGVREQEK